jgi:putative addiction module CopG family antidote
MNVSLTPELERLVNEKVESGLNQTASEVVREAFRLLKERDQAREQLRADVQAGFDQLARREGRAYDKTSGRQLAERIKSLGRAKSQPRTPYRLSSLAERDLEERRCQPRPVILEGTEMQHNDFPDTAYTTTWSNGRGEVRFFSRPDGPRLRYYTAGTGPPLVLMHTVRTQLDYFQRVIPRLWDH